MLYVSYPYDIVQVGGFGILKWVWVGLRCYGFHSCSFAFVSCSSFAVDRVGGGMKGNATFVGVSNSDRVQTREEDKNIFN
jgi:hypothetical protein